MSEKGRQNLVWGERGLWMGGWLNRIVSKDILVKSAREGAFSEFENMATLLFLVQHSFSCDVAAIAYHVIT